MLRHALASAGLAAAAFAPPLLPTRPRQGHRLSAKKVNKPEAKPWWSSAPAKPPSAPTASSLPEYPLAESLVVFLDKAVNTTQQYLKPALYAGGGAVLGIVTTVAVVISGPTLQGMPSAVEESLGVFETALVELERGCVRDGRTAGSAPTPPLSPRPFLKVRGPDRPAQAAADGYDGHDAQPRPVRDCAAAVLLLFPGMTTLSCYTHPLLLRRILTYQRTAPLSGIRSSKTRRAQWICASRSRGGTRAWAW